MSFRRWFRNRKRTLSLLIFVLIVAATYKNQTSLKQPKSDGDSIVASSADVYYSGTYWNDYEQVQEYLNERISGNIHIDWAHQLIKWRNNKKFKKALILSCGNGWVERMLIERGVIESAVGVDVNEELLSQAKLSANGLPLRYYQLDSNKDENFPEKDYDIVINHAALHHVAYIDYHVRGIYKILKRDGGILFNYEYVGPHRNQYSEETWKAITYVNDLTHASLKHRQLNYPHLPTMLVMDPSEAVHSELIKSTLSRYFEPIVSIPLGGALAYPLLTHNDNLKRNTNQRAVSAHIKFVLDEDAKFEKRHPESGLFWYSIMQIKGDVNEKDMAQWTQDEVNRENHAKQNGGQYYPPTTVHQRFYGVTSA